MDKQPNQNPQTQSSWTYRETLSYEFGSRRQKNGSYSLRSFARDLGLQPSQLSGVLKGTKNISAEKAVSISQKMSHWSKQKKDVFVLAVQYALAGSPELKERWLKQIKSKKPKIAIHEESLDRFKLISDWYHLPILAMVDLETPNIHPKGIAKKLGISEHIANQALFRLRRLGLLLPAPDKGPGHFKFSQDGQRLVFSSPEVNRAMNLFHQTMLKKASEALESQTLQERIFRSETLAIAPEALPQIRDLTQRFLSELVTLADQFQPNTEIYHLDFAFFRISKPEPSLHSEKQPKTRRTHEVK